MIATLHIKNIGIIDDITLNLNNGFNVLTGETGAGKSLIIDSLGIVSGGRFQKEMIRNNQNFSSVELNMFIPNHKDAIDGSIIVSREVYTNGRNNCKINGRLVTVNELKNFMIDIIDIHGQHDNQSILDETTHIDFLDEFIGEEIMDLKKQYMDWFDEYNKIKQELKKNYGDEKEKQRKLDLLRYQYKEIDEAKLKKGEEEDLDLIRNKILNSEKITENLLQADTLIGDTVLEALNTSLRGIEKIEDLDEKYKNVAESLRSVYYDLEEISRDISALSDDTYFDEQERMDVETRLDLISDLKRKYGSTIEEILKFRDSVEEEIYEIENLEGFTNKLKVQLEKVEQNMKLIASKMSTIRLEKALKLDEKINIELNDLEMKNAKFKVEILQDSEFNVNGIDKVAFTIKTNVGEGYNPLIKIASGGEMSRIMLAIKSVLADVDKVPILIFDEIDTGISGKAANAVSEKMKKISKNHQVICVTHLASIACNGDYNYYISKKVEKGQTYTSIKLLNEDETIEEIARISSGNITTITLEHAKELRKMIRSLNK